MSQPRRLLASELEILDVLWKHGPLSIIEVQRHLPEGVSYTTVQTRLNRMVGKELLDRTPERPSKYSAGISRQSASATDLKLLVKRVGQGHIVPLVAQLIQSRPLKPEEYTELRELIDEAQRKAQKARKSGGKS